MSPYKFLTTQPTAVLAGFLEDAASEAKAMRASSITLPAHSLFRGTTAMEMFNLCAQVLRERLAAKLQRNLDKMAWS